MSSEQSGQSSRGIFSFLVVLLLMVIIGLQLWYMLDVKKQLDIIQGEYDSLQSIINGSASSSEQKTSSIISSTDAASNDETAQGKADLAETEQAQTTSDNVTAGSDTTTSLNNDPASSAPHNTQQNLRQPPPRNINPYYPPFRAYPEPYTGPYPEPYLGPNWDPYEDIRRMHQEMREKMERAFDDRLYSHPYGKPYNRPGNRPGNSQGQQQDFEYHFRENFSTPKINVQQNDKQYYISVNIPGADENDVSVKLEGQYLTIVGKQKTQQQQSDPEGRFSFSHSRSGKFRRTITLREPVDEKGMQTRIENGVLMISIPKRVL
jgi:HSP20 family molecular chaperone IbpA